MKCSFNLFYLARSFGYEFQNDSFICENKIQRLYLFKSYWRYFRTYLFFRFHAALTQVQNLPGIQNYDPWLISITQLEKNGFAGFRDLSSLGFTSSLVAWSPHNLIFDNREKSFIKWCRIVNGHSQAHSNTGSNF